MNKHNKKNCRECSKDLNFLSFHKIEDKLYCFRCYTQLLRRMNGFKPLPKGYGIRMKILEKMVRLSLTKYKVVSIKQLRVIAIKEIHKQYPIVIANYLNDLKKEKEENKK